MAKEKRVLKLKAGPGANPIPVSLRPGHGQDQAGTGSGHCIVAGGWHPDLPDLRDHGLHTPSFKKPLQEAKVRLAAPTAKLPGQADNRAWCSSVENQQSLGSCTAHSVVGMLEYMMRRGVGEHTDLARLFLYKVTRKLLGWTGDTGAYIRSAVKAAVAFGVPPEQYYPYDIARYEDEPDAFVYSYAHNFKEMAYARLDPYNATGKQTLEEVKRVLAAGFVACFGFSVYSSMSTDPFVPYPTPKDKLQGGHAVLAVGYDDQVQVEGADGKMSTVGCLIFRNSWGSDWGEDGYGYLPYGYVEDALAVDFWTVSSYQWLKEKNFS